MLSMPCLIIGLKIYLPPFNKVFSDGGFSLNLGYLADSRVKKFIKPEISFWERTRIYVASIVHEILHDPEIEQEGLNYLDKVFRHPQTQEAGLALLTQVLKDKRFMDEAQIFGTDLISFVLLREQIKQDFKNLVIKTLEDEEVKKETINVLEYITNQKQSEEIMAAYFNKVFLRRDILDNLTTLLTASVCHTLSDNTTQKLITDFAVEVTQNKTIKQEVFENYLYKPVRSFISFGYLEAENERLQGENEKLQDFRERSRQYELNKEAVDEAAKAYPGLEESQRLYDQKELRRQ